MKKSTKGVMGGFEGKKGKWEIQLYSQKKLKVKNWDVIFRKETQLILGRWHLYGLG